MNEFLQTNLDHWQEITEINYRSAFYDVEGFKNGRNALNALEIEELGNVSGKSLLHLQCHFGQDTLSWARLGAEVTGVDFSSNAIEKAHELSQQTGLDGRFIECNLYDLPQHLDEQFDIVFTSYGVLGWLPDIREWARLVSRYLKPGGVFYIAEFHPFAMTLYDESNATDLRLHYPYFQGNEPTHFEPSDDGAYADPNANVSTSQYEWFHTIGDIVTSLITAGLTIEFLHEFPHSVYRQLPMAKPIEDGLWTLGDRHGDVPLMFSIRANKSG